MAGSDNPEQVFRDVAGKSLLGKLNRIEGLSRCHYDHVAYILFPRVRISCWNYTSIQKNVSMLLRGRARVTKGMMFYTSPMQV